MFMNHTKLHVPWLSDEFLLGTATKTEDQVKSRLLLDVIIRKSSSVFKLFTSEDETLLVWWNTFLVLDLGLYVFNGIRSLDFKSDGFSGQGLHEDLHTTTKTEDEMKGRFLLDVVVRKCTSIFKLFTGENETLLIWWNTFLILNFSLHVFDGIGGFNFKCNRFTGQGLDENLHTAPKSKDEMKCRFLLDVIIGECTAIFELLSGENETLLIWWDTFFILNLGFDVFDGVRGLDFKSDSFSGQCFDEDLHTTTKSKDKMKG